MSKYTTQLRWIVEQIGSGLPQPRNHRYPDAVYKYIGLDKYPIFDEEYRYPLNDKIIDHFYFREIGFETAAQFAWYLRRTMNEIMPKYNMLYEAMENIVPEELLSDKTNKHNESWDKDETEGIDRTLAKTGTDTTTHDGTVESANSGTIVSANTGTITDSGQTSDSLDSNTTTNTTDHNRNVFQDTPMSLLDNSSSPTIEGLDYATNVTYDDGTSDIETELDQTRAGTSSNTRTLGDTNTKTLGDTNTKTFDNSDTLEHDTLDNENIDRSKNDKGWRVWTDFGRNTSLSSLAQEFIDKWVNVDMAVIGDLEDLFMGLW